MQAYQIDEMVELSQAAGSMRSIRESRKNPHSDGGWPILTDLTRKHITEGRGFSKNCYEIIETLHAHK